jgi:hypothetical protein
MLIDIDVIEEICSKCVKMEEFFIVIEPHNLVGYVKKSPPFSKLKYPYSMISPIAYITLNHYGQSTSTIH